MLGRIIMHLFDISTLKRRRRRPERRKMMPEIRQRRKPARR
jgi:hypothetical protein